MISGKRSERLQTVEHQAQMLRRDLDQLRARQASQSPAVKARLARIEAPVAAGYNTFAVTFLNGEFSETSGVTTPAYADRGTGFAHNLRSADMNVGDIVKVWPWSGRWWFERGVSQPPSPVKILVNWIDWNRDETNGTWVNAYASARGVLGRFSNESLPPTDPNFPGSVVMRRNAAGSADLSSLGLSPGTPITSAIITLQQGNGIAASTQNFIGDADIQNEDNPPLVNTFTALQINNWNLAPQGPIGYTLTPAYGDQVDLDVTSLVQHVIDRPGFAGQNLNIRITTSVSQPINGPNSGSFGASIVNITQDIEDSFITITL